MVIDRTWIQAHIPHQGSMCLLDGVLEWGDEHAICIATSQMQPSNPLRHLGSLGISTGLEYAAQAMAVHGALTAASDHKPTSGYLTSARQIEWSETGWGSALEHPITITVRKQAEVAGSLQYSFEIAGPHQNSTGAPLLTGRLTVMLDAASPWHLS